MKDRIASILNEMDISVATLWCDNPDRCTGDCNSCKTQERLKELMGRLWAAIEAGAGGIQPDARGRLRTVVQQRDARDA